MATLSQWDIKHFTPEEQQYALGIKEQWGTDPNQNASLHSALEAIRANYNYSGGVDGSQFMPTDMYNAPKTPVIAPYESPRQGEIDALWKQVKNPPKYESQYEDLIAQSISDIRNRPKFEYDPETDTAFQAFKASAGRAADKAFADNLGGLSAMTGGRANSWAGTVASNARGNMLMQAEEAVIHFEDRAYSRYKDEGADMYNLVNLLQSQDQIMYNRFRDTIGDSKDLFNMVMQLDDRDYRNYKDMADNEWKVFDAEYNKFKDTLTMKKDKITEAINRTDMTGFVNNEDSITLGVPVGTLSQGARERAEDMEDYVTKLELDLEQEKKLMAERHSYDVKLNNMRSQSSSSGGRSGSGSPSTPTTPALSMADFGRRDAKVAEFTDIVDTPEYKALNPKARYNKLTQWEQKLIADTKMGLLGKDGEIVLGMILDDISKNPIYKTDVLLYEEWQIDRAGVNVMPKKKTGVE